MALANHGGGFILLGFEDGDAGMIEAADRPKALTAYSQDIVNGIVEPYCEPSFHCEVRFESSPAGSVFPVVKVPGGHRVPCVRRSRRRKRRFSEKTTSTCESQDREARLPTAPRNGTICCLAA